MLRCRHRGTNGIHSPQGQHDCRELDDAILLRDPGGLGIQAQDANGFASTGIIKELAEGLVGNLDFGHGFPLCCHIRPLGVLCVLSLPFAIATIATNQHFFNCSMLKTPHVHTICTFRQKSPSPQSESCMVLNMFC